MAAVADAVRPGAGGVDVVRRLRRLRGRAAAGRGAVRARRAGRDRRGVDDALAVRRRLHARLPAGRGRGAAAGPRGRVGGLRGVAPRPLRRRRRRAPLRGGAARAGRVGGAERAAALGPARRRRRRRVRAHGRPLRGEPARRRDALPRPVVRRTDPRPGGPGLAADGAAGGLPARAARLERILRRGDV